MTVIIYCYGDGKPMVFGIENLTHTDRDAITTLVGKRDQLSMEHAETVKSEAQENKISNLEAERDAARQALQTRTAGKDRG